MTTASDYEVPVLRGMGNFLLKLIPADYRGAFGYKGDRTIGLTNFGQKELATFKYWLIRAIPFIQGYANKLSAEKNISHPRTDNFFRENYDADVLWYINNFLNDLREMNEDLITNDEVKAEFYRTIEIEKERYIKDIFKEFNPSKPKSPINNINPLDLISQDKVSVLQMWEDALRGEIEKWLKGEDVELCAAFINHLFGKKFFNPNTISTGIQFALARYQINIKHTIDKLRRKKNNALLSQRTDEINRLIHGKKYGKM